MNKRALALIAALFMMVALTFPSPARTAMEDQPLWDAGEVDMIGACITITPERAKQVLFSEPYYTGGIAALVRE